MQKWNIMSYIDTNILIRYVLGSPLRPFARPASLMPLYQLKTLSAAKMWLKGRIFYKSPISQLVN